MPESIQYDNEMVEAHAQSGERLGMGRFHGAAQKSAEGLWTWAGRFLPLDPNQAVLLAGGRVQLTFRDGAQGEAVVLRVRKEMRRDVYELFAPGWSADLRGDGEPPRAGPAK